MIDVESLPIDWKDFQFKGFTPEVYDLPIFDTEPEGCPRCGKGKGQWLFRRSEWEHHHNKTPWEHDGVCYMCILRYYANIPLNVAPWSSIGDARVPYRLQPTWDLGLRKVTGPLGQRETSLYTTWIMRGKDRMEGFNVDVFSVALWVTAMWPRWNGSLGPRQVHAYTALAFLRGWINDGKYRTFFHTAGRYARNKNKASTRHHTSTKKKR